MRFVLDASVAAAWLLTDENEADAVAAVEVLQRLGNPNSQAFVPQTWFLEVANVVARSEAKGLATENQSQAFLELLKQLPIAVDSDTAARCLNATLDIARRYGLSAYDASYLELAMRAQLPLATFDKELRIAAQRAGIAVS